MPAITFELHLREPLLATRLAGDPNSAVSYDYIPGSLIRGALIGRYLQEQPNNDNDWPPFDVTSQATQDLFFNGTTRFLNAYPLVHNDIRTLPLPRSWRYPKEDRNKLVDHAREQIDPEKQWKDYGETFAHWQKPTATTAKIEKNIAIHTTRNRHMGRAVPQETVDRHINENDEAGGVFRYEALAAGQRFGSVIVCDNDTDAQMLKGLLEQTKTMLLGGARSAGYGHVNIEYVDGPTSWQEITPSTNGHLIVTLLSDALLRNEKDGQYAVSVTTVTQALQQVAEELKIETKPLQPISERAFLRHTLLGGFNRKWNLPLPQATAVSMGSVCVFENPGWSETEMSKIMTHGIGERRAEGFGRLALNAHPVSPLKLERDKPQIDAQTTTLAPKSAAGKMALLMQRRLTEQALEHELMVATNTLMELLKNDGIPDINKTQIGRLRAMIQRAMQEEPQKGKALLLKFSERLDGRQITSKQFRRLQLESKPFLEWMELQLADLETLPDTGLPALVTKEQWAESKKQLAYSYHLRRIDTVLARIAKEKRGQDDDNEN